jgi:hypothetical protein
VKLIFDKKYGELLGAHMIGANVTEMIAEIVVARKLETTGHEIIKSIHPHPTMSEAIMEAAACGLVFKKGEVIINIFVHFSEHSRQSTIFNRACSRKCGTPD